MLTITADDVGRHDLLFAACSAEMFERQYSVADHPSCQAALSRALAPFGISGDRIPTPFNAFMCVDVDPETGALSVRAPRSVPGSAVTLRGRDGPRRRRVRLLGRAHERRAPGPDRPPLPRALTNGAGTPRDLRGNRAKPAFITKSRVRIVQVVSCSCFTVADPGGGLEQAVEDGGDRKVRARNDLGDSGRELVMKAG